MCNLLFLELYRRKVCEGRFGFSGHDQIVTLVMTFALLEMIDGTILGALCIYCLVLKVGSDLIVILLWCNSLLRSTIERGAMERITRRRITTRRYLSPLSVCLFS